MASDIQNQGAVKQPSKSLVLAVASACFDAIGDDAAAQCHLGKTYIRGVPGLIEADPVVAAFWINLAKRNGDYEANEIATEQSKENPLFRTPPAESAIRLAGASLREFFTANRALPNIGNRYDVLLSELDHFVTKELQLSREITQKEAIPGAVQQKEDVVDFFRRKAKTARLPQRPSEADAVLALLVEWRKAAQGAAGFLSVFKYRQNRPRLTKQEVAAARELLRENELLYELNGRRYGKLVTSEQSKVVHLLPL